MILQSKRDRTNWIKSSACSPNSYQWGIRLTQGMPTSCGRADPIPADYTACRGHLSEADTHHNLIEDVWQGWCLQTEDAPVGNIFTNNTCVNTGDGYNFPSSPNYNGLGPT